MQIQDSHAPRSAAPWIASSLFASNADWAKVSSWQRFHLVKGFILGTEGLQTNTNNTNSNNNNNNNNNRRENKKAMSSVPSSQLFSRFLSMRPVLSQAPHILQELEERRPSFWRFCPLFFFFFVFLVFSCCLLQARGGDPRSPQKAFLVLKIFAQLHTRRREERARRRAEFLRLSDFL